MNTGRSGRHGNKGKSYLIKKERKLRKGEPGTSNTEQKERKLMKQVNCAAAQTPSL